MTEELYQEFPCDLCGAMDTLELPHSREYTKDQPIYICKKCGFVYVQKRRSSKAIADAWSNELYGDHYTAYRPAMKARLTYVADFINNNISLKGKKVCDIGAGEGYFLNLLSKEYGAQVFGIEPSKKNCLMMDQLNIPNFVGTIEEYCVSPQAQDYQAELATIIWTLENCLSCKDMLAGAYSLIKDDGYVAVATGSRILVPFKKPLQYYLGPHALDTHSFRFSANALRGILAISGFEVIQMNRYIDTDYLCVVAQKRPMGTKIPWVGDEYQKVADFFERWHKESAFYV